MARLFKHQACNLAALNPKVEKSRIANVTGRPAHVAALPLHDDVPTRPQTGIFSVERQRLEKLEASDEPRHKFKHLYAYRMKR
jgi:hypothetical protein